jgi:uncharacterized membrane-anchored protein
MNELLIILASMFDAEDMAIIGGVIGLYLLCFVIFGLYVFLIRFYIAYRMAKNRHRNVLLWVLLSIFVSPIAVWIALAALGEKKEGEDETIKL